MMLRLSNVTMELSNVSKTNKLLNIINVRSYIMLGLINITIELSNMSKNKNKESTECDKSTISCDVGII